VARVQKNSHSLYKILTDFISQIIFLLKYALKFICDSKLNLEKKLSLKKPLEIFRQSNSLNSIYVHAKSPKTSRNSTDEPPCLYEYNILINCDKDNLLYFILFHSFS
jgi:hypothetical protein